MTVAALTSAALAGAGGGATALAQPSPKIVVKDGVTQPVFSYKDAIREHVYVESSVDSDRDGRRTASTSTSSGPRRPSTASRCR